jgi:hypothetical protein
MKVISHGLPAQDGQVPEMNRRSDARKMVSVNTLVADKIGLARGLVTNISRSGCQVSLTRPLRPAQYITLKMYPDDGAAIQINLGRVQWVKEKGAGIKFLSMPEQHRLGLSRFYGEQVEFPSSPRSLSATESTSV